MLLLHRQNATKTTTLGVTGSIMQIRYQINFRREEKRNKARAMHIVRDRAPIKRQETRKKKKEKRKERVKQQGHLKSDSLYGCGKPTKQSQLSD
ncbi:MAG: hypothetical protein ACRDDD_04445 [Plesiomonas sp.]|uniref:hypothetical protein n=1 Tax=Plesiomonas sp. TaxID=2486279 RepID=UPI003EE70298